MKYNRIQANSPRLTLPREHANDPVDTEQDEEDPPRLTLPREHANATTKAYA